MQQNDLCAFWGQPAHCGSDSQRGLRLLTGFIGARRIRQWHVIHAPARYSTGRPAANCYRPLREPPTVSQPRQPMASHRERLLGRVFCQMCVRQPAPCQTYRHSIMPIVQFTKTPHVPKARCLDKLGISACRGGTFF